YGRRRLVGMGRLPGLPAEALQPRLAHGRKLRYLRHDSLKRIFMVIASIEINRPPDVVFDYIAQLDRHGEWQPAVLGARKDPPGPTRLGTRNIETRRVPGGPREFISEVTQYDPPRILSFQGVDGPVRPRGTVNVDPIGDGSRSRVTLKLDF